MNKELSIFKTLEKQGFTTIDIDHVFNYLETLDYDLNNTRYIGKIIAKNERLAKYFFLRDQFQIEMEISNECFHINEILDQCIDWSEFWRLLVIKKGFCCIRLPGDLIRKRFIFMSGPNLLLGPYSDQTYSIYEDINYS